MKKWWKGLYSASGRFAQVIAHMEVLRHFVVAKLCEDYLGIPYAMSPRIEDPAGILQDEKATGAPTVRGDELIRIPLEELDVDVRHATARLLQIMNRGSPAIDLELINKAGDEETWQEFFSGDKRLWDDLSRSRAMNEGRLKKLWAKFHVEEVEKPSGWLRWLTSIGQ